jgi:predicted TIM-barrel fold metal-dependent hydrolase
MLTTTKAAEVRRKVGHPIVDADGHFVEIGPIIDDEIAQYVEEIGGAQMRERYLAQGMRPTDTATNTADRDDPIVRQMWAAMPSWWGWPVSNVRDRATSHLPRLLYDRLDEMGIDFAVLYPSMTIAFLDLSDDELAGVVARAVNMAHAKRFAKYADRMTVAAMVPMRTPEMAIAEANYAVKELGFKSILIAGYARRQLEGSTDPRGFRLDTFGLDSAYDYDPFWQTCIDLRVAPVSHSSHQYHRITRSVSSYVYNHIGGIATAQESLCKSLFLGGVTRRFPSLRVGFLEGGVAWACSLFADTVGHWDKRNGKAIHDLDPHNLDVDALMSYVAEWGDPDMVAQLDRLRAYFSRTPATPKQVDEFAALAADSKEELKELFESRFYFGCEGDDKTIAWAFAQNVNPAGARLRPMIGSDISHWDVPDMLEPIEEAYELVEDGLIGDDEFRELTYLNAVRLHAGMNPDFFKGTVVDKAVAQAITDGQV